MKDLNPKKTKHGGIFYKTLTSSVYVPQERNSSAEALICLDCPLPAKECNPDACKRYKGEKAKLRRPRSKPRGNV